MTKNHQLLCNKNTYLYTKLIIIVEGKTLIQTRTPWSGFVMSPNLKKWSYRGGAFFSRKWRWIIFHIVVQYLLFPEVWGLKYIFGLVRYFKTVLLLLIGFQNNSDISVLVLLSYKYIILYHMLFCGFVLKYFIQIALKLPSSWKWSGIFLLLMYFSAESKHHLFALSLKNRLQ